MLIHFLRCGNNFTPSQFNHFSGREMMMAKLTKSNNVCILFSVVQATLFFFSYAIFLFKLRYFFVPLREDDGSLLRENLT
jgi:hypothetical protein